MGSTCVKCGTGSLSEMPTGTACKICGNAQVLIYKCDNCGLCLCTKCGEEFQEGKYHCGLCKGVLGLDKETYKGKKCTDCGKDNILMYKCMNSKCRLPFCSKCSKGTSHSMSHKAENIEMLKTTK